MKNHRTRAFVTLLVPVLFITALVTAQQKMSSELQALVETERAFAKTATVKGLRDSFLDYFADDAIAFAPGATSAKERLRTQQAEPFSVLEIVWEPRTGDVAASNDLGWLTGPSTIVNHAAPQPAPRHGNYLSVWRRQPDGAWRVFIDVGVRLPEPASFAPGFVRASLPTHYSRADRKVAATATLLEADRALNDAVAAGGPGKAYADRLTASSRLHRAGVPPVIGPAAIGAWLTEHAASMSAKSSSAEASTAGDLGYSYGTYALTGTPAETGAYVRVWMRDASGKWFVVADVTQPS